MLAALAVLALAAAPSPHFDFDPPIGARQTSTNNSKFTSAWVLDGNFLGLAAPVPCPHTAQECFDGYLAQVQATTKAVLQPGVAHLSNDQGTIVLWRDMKMGETHIPVAMVAKDGWAVVAVTGIADGGQDRAFQNEVMRALLDSPFHPESDAKAQQAAENARLGSKLEFGFDPPQGAWQPEAGSNGRTYLSVDRMARLKVSAPGLLHGRTVANLAAYQPTSSWQVEIRNVKVAVITDVKFPTYLAVRTWFERGEPVVELAFFMDLHGREVTIRGWGKKEAWEAIQSSTLAMLRSVEAHALADLNDAPANGR